MIFRQSAGYIGNTPPLSKQSLPQAELATVRWAGDWTLMLKLSVRILTLTLFGTLSFNKWFKNSCFLMCKTGIVNSAHKGVLINKDFKDFVNFTGLATTWGDVVTEVDHITLHVVRTLGEWCTMLYSTIRYSFLWVKLPLFFNQHVLPE